MDSCVRSSTSSRLDMADSGAAGCTAAVSLQQSLKRGRHSASFAGHDSAPIAAPPLARSHSATAASYSRRTPCTSSRRTARPASSACSRLIALPSSIVAPPLSMAEGSCDLPAVSRAADPPVSANYEYLDHPADIQIHAWGDSLGEAFEQAALAMFGYMTELSTVEATRTEQVTAQGDDLESLLFHFLDEWLFIFSAEPFFVPKRVTITEFNMDTFTIVSEGFGEVFTLGKHPQGTEVKAITYSNLQVHESRDKHEVYVIVDI